MKYVAVTIFPELLEAFWGNGIVRRAVQSGTIATHAINIRDFADDRHKTTDDRPYGGGCGMVMKPEPLTTAIRAAKREAPDAPVVLLSPQGRLFDQQIAERLAGSPGLILICGRYEGIDERVVASSIDLALSIGDFVLTGGELAAMVVMDAVTRLIPGALGNEDSAEQDSFRHGRLDHAHYTRPAVFEGVEAPAVLISGHHELIARWRQTDSLLRTLAKRPDLLHKGPLSPQEVELLETWRLEIDRLMREQAGGGPDPSPGGG